MEQKADFVYNVCLGAALVLLTQLVVAWDQTVGESHWWDIVTAIGTAGAAIGAVWIATTQRRDIRKTEWSRAIVVAGAVRLRLEAAIPLAGVVARGVARLKDVGGFHPIELAFFRDRLREAQLEFSFDEIAMLTPLPGAIAVRVAMSQSSVRHGVAMLDALLLPGGTGPGMDDINLQGQTSAVGQAEAVCRAYEELRGKLDAITALGRVGKWS